MKRFIALSAFVLVAGCSQEPAPTANEKVSDDDAFAIAMAAADAAAAENDATGGPAPKTETVVALSDADKGRVCRAAIASLMGRDPSIIRVISASGGIHRVRYTRDDGTVWTNECRVGNGTAEWRAFDNGQPGRWRNEDTIRFTLDGSTINIQSFMSGELVTNDTYEVK